MGAFEEPLTLRDVVCLLKNLGGVGRLINLERTPTGLHFDYPKVNLNPVVDVPQREPPGFKSILGSKSGALNPDVGSSDSKSLSTRLMFETLAKASTSSRLPGVLCSAKLELAWEPRFGHKRGDAWKAWETRGKPTKNRGNKGKTKRKTMENQQCVGFPYYARKHLSPFWLFVAGPVKSSSSRKSFAV